MDGQGGFIATFGFEPLGAYGQGGLQTESDGTGGVINYVGGLTARFYNEIDFTGFTDELLITDFSGSALQWQNSPPATTSTPPYSVIFEGRFIPAKTGSYSFKTTHNGPMKLTVNGTVLQDETGDALVTTDSTAIALVADTPVSIRYEHARNLGSHSRLGFRVLPPSGGEPFLDLPPNDNAVETPEL